MPTSSQDTYSARLQRAMSSHDCSPIELAHACGCTVQRIRAVIKDGNNKPLGTRFNERAALYLQVSASWLYLGNALALPPRLVGPFRNATRVWYDELDATSRQAFHTMLRQAVRGLIEDKPKRGRTQT